MHCVAQLSAPWREPAEVLSAFAGEPWAVGLVSGGARWSYLARDPEATLILRAVDARDPFDALAVLLGPAAPAAEDGPPFQGGVVGLAAYELADRVESLGLPRQDAWPDLAAARYLAILAFDHQARMVVAVGRGSDLQQAEARANAALAWLDAAPVAPRQEVLAGPLQPSDPDAYEAAVAQVVDRIRAGEIFQANIARAWTGALAPGAQPFDLFARLLAQSAAPFAAYLRLPGLALVSNSPERFLKVREGQVETQPIKGTRPRGGDPAADAALAAELLASDKDRAENLMIVDLMRNDLARVCAAGSVRVPSLWALESFANVHHLVSTVTGRLAEGQGALDLLRAAFPPGSITGAPKVQAMKVIAALETPRGPYCGSLFWAGFDGALDSSVLIRTAACTETAGGWAVEARAGAGIVEASEPVAERLETEAKIAALVRALTQEPCP
ncbi:aminodeoxychorismate synthase component I [Phenylobacterium sp. Root77]|uniref:aminodeoxychorismate synthase, component I n=1 Tax=unclassified Phenylobacterium TaxID=2640670 RepID=UPI0006FCB13C|nr:MULTISPECIES: aminodeoxychorismate synthase, component I [unclassified Phenylobacterium]KQW71017.1 aminodeoxychorismate synthase component I [Phenylobacterium sp. Root1277]KQW95825.1 aminodeoxychorismate synthase component I [Phenylobacterium sp. Root1290]KRC41610.1 aminodeoxychorismate synthase component I [Phenylobacterium sp. Root77]